MNEINIPSKIKVGYKDYEVRRMERLDDNEHLLYGEVQYNNELINLCSRYPENQQKCTLIHELTHAIDNMLDIGLSEGQVEKLGAGFYQVIKDNPQMFQLKK